MTTSSSGDVLIHLWWFYFFPVIRDTSDCVCVCVGWWWVGWGRWVGGGRGVSKRRPEGVMGTTRMVGTL